MRPSYQDTTKHTYQYIYYKALDDRIKLANILISGNIRSRDIRRSSVLTLIAIPVSIPRLSLSATYFNVDRSNSVDWSIEIRPRPMVLVSRLRLMLRSCRAGIVLLIVYASDTRD